MRIRRKNILIDRHYHTRTVYSAGKIYAYRQNKQRHFYSTGKIACRLSKSIVGWNIHMARSRNRKILSGLWAQREGVSAVQVMQ